MALAKRCDICGTYITPLMEDKRKSVIVDAGLTKTMRVWYAQAIRKFEKYGVWDSEYYGTYNVGSNRKKRYVRDLRVELKRMVREEKKRRGVAKLPVIEYRHLRNFTGVNSYE